MQSLTYIMLAAQREQHLRDVARTAWQLERLPTRPRRRFGRRRRTGTRVLARVEPAR